MSKDEWMEWTLDTWFVRGESDPDHPAVFPIEIPRRLVMLYTYPGERVIDLFDGRGSTGVACVKTGRRFIGIDIHEPYCEIAKQRIKEAMLQPRML